MLLHKSFVAIEFAIFGGPPFPLAEEEISVSYLQYLFRPPVYACGANPMRLLPASNTTNWEAKRMSPKMLRPCPIFDWMPPKQSVVKVICQYF